MAIKFTDTQLWRLQQKYKILVQDLPPSPVGNRWYGVSNGYGWAFAYASSPKQVVNRIVSKIENWLERHPEDKGR